MSARTRSPFILLTWNVVQQLFKKTCFSVNQVVKWIRCILLSNPVSCSCLRTLQVFVLSRTRRRQDKDWKNLNTERIQTYSRFGSWNVVLWCLCVGEWKENVSKMDLSPSSLSHSLVLSEMLINYNASSINGGSLNAMLVVKSLQRGQFISIRGWVFY